MQRKLIAAAILGLAPFVAQAQTAVTVYGVVDAAVAHEDADAPGVASRTSIHAGQASSRIGFRGTEDLGGGLKALFNLEAGFGVDTGLGDAALFGRRAVVGLEGDFGTVTAGREYTPIDMISQNSHILGQGFYGTNLNAFATGTLTRRISNSLNYRSKAFAGGFRFNAAIGLGEAIAGPSGDYHSLSAEYQNGPLFAGLGYATRERLATGDDKEWILGAGYTIGAVELKGNYMVGDPVGTRNKFTQANIGAAMAFGPGKLYGNLQQNKLENGARGNGFAITYSYALSKRTNLYTSYATISNNNRATFALSAAGSTITPPATALGSDPTAFAVGMRHTF